MGVMLVSSSRRGGPVTTVFSRKSKGFRSQSRTPYQGGTRGALKSLKRFSGAARIGYASGMAPGRTGRARKTTHMYQELRRTDIGSGIVYTKTGRVRRRVIHQPRHPRGTSRGGRWR